MKRRRAPRAFGTIRIAASLALLLVPHVASAQSADAPAPAPSSLVPLAVDVEGSVVVVSAAGRASCFGPCVLRVAPGYVRVQAAGSSVERYVDGPSRLHQTTGAPALRSAGLVTLGVGVVILIAAVAIPIFVCDSTTKQDAFGRQTTSNPCRDLSDGVKIAWIAGGSIGLTAATVGAIVTATAGPHLRVEQAAPPALPPVPGVSFAPWLRPTRAEGAGDIQSAAGIEAGVTGIVRF